MYVFFSTNNSLWLFAEKKIQKQESQFLVKVNTSFTLKSD